MSEEKQDLGIKLRDQRRELNLSLKEAENATSIRMSYLKAIEEGNIADQISAVYAQGFVRQYASYLGLDGDLLVQEHPEHFAPTTVRQEFSYGIGTLEMRNNPGAGVKWLPNVAWVAAFGGILIVGWLLARYLEVL